MTLSTVVCSEEEAAIYNHGARSVRQYNHSERQLSQVWLVRHHVRESAISRRYLAHDAIRFPFTPVRIKGFTIMHSTIMATYSSNLSPRSLSSQEVPRLDSDSQKV